MCRHRMAELMGMNVCRHLWMFFMHNHGTFIKVFVNTPLTQRIAESFFWRKEQIVLINRIFTMEPFYI